MYQRKEIWLTKLSCFGVVTTEAEKIRPAERVRELYIAMTIRVRISGTRPLRSAGASSPAGRGWVSPMPGDIVEVLLQDGAWAIGTVSLYAYPGGTSVRISVNGGQPTYFARCHVRFLEAPPMQVLEVSSNGRAKRRRRHRHRQARRERRETNLEYSGVPRCDAESAESSNECYL